MTIPFGLGLPIVQQVPLRAQAWEAAAGAKELVEIAQAADRLGFAHISCSDHVLVPRSRVEAMGAPWYDAAVTLAFLAGVTERVRLLSHVVVLPYRHPLVIAKAFATLDHLSQGRVILGVGSGHLKPEFKVLGAPYEQRGKISDEYLQAIAAAWEQDIAHFSGTNLRFADVVVAPRPAQRPRPPIWVGGNAPAVVRRAARYADGWIPWQLGPEEFGAAVARAREIAAAAGRTAALEFVAPLSIAATDQPNEIARQIDVWRRAGATYFHVGLASRSLADFLARMDWFAREVMVSS
ncbi:MAG TPA: TIGR03619 family F420-dependent LLM class oxidoreductase [Candidatus Kryptonia bacterium]|nr:TIGR03619 family F420-dependent LLM class oxidoreductase [Candidatus Kryptonia bacterium]